MSCEVDLTTVGEGCVASDQRARCHVARGTSPDRKFETWSRLADFPAPAPQGHLAGTSTRTQRVRAATVGTTIAQVSMAGPSCNSVLDRELSRLMTYAAHTTAGQQPGDGHAQEPNPQPLRLPWLLPTTRSDRVPVGTPPCTRWRPRDSATTYQKSLVALAAYQECPERTVLGRAGGSAGSRRSRSARMTRGFQ